MIEIQYDEEGLVPVIVQDAENGQVLMMAYANKEAISRTKETGFGHFFSRSRGKIWKKGEESGHVQTIRSILIDCDGDALLYIVDQKEAACHTGYRSCFYRTIEGDIIGEKIFEPENVYPNKR